MALPPVHHEFAIEQLPTLCSRCSLRELCLPRGLNEAELSRLEEEVDANIKVAHGVNLIKPDQPLRQLYAVRSGAFKSYRYDNDGEEQVIGFHFPGELFGLDAIYPKAHQCFVAPLVDSSACAIDYQQLDQIIDKVPALRRQLMRLMSRELGTRADFARNQSADQAMAGFLLDVANRHRERGEDVYRFELLMNRRDIANLLRLRTETVSRVLRRFQDHGWLSVNRKFVEILDRAALEQVAA